MWRINFVSVGTTDLHVRAETFFMEFVSIFTGNASKYKWRHAQKQI